VSVAGQRIEVEVALFHILAVVPLDRHQSEEALLEDRIALVPERHRPAEDLVAIGEAGDAVFAPSVGPGSRNVVRAEFPCVLIGAVVFAHRAPGAVGEVRSPLAPARDGVRVAGQTFAFGGHWTALAYLV